MLKQSKYCRNSNEHRSQRTEKEASILQIALKTTAITHELLLLLPAVPGVVTFAAAAAAVAAVVTVSATVAVTAVVVTSAAYVVADVAATVADVAATIIEQRFYRTSFCRRPEMLNV